MVFLGLTVILLVMVLVLGTAVAVPINKRLTRIRCAHCGKRVRQTAKRRPYCGKPIVQEGKKTRNARPAARV